jgi:hypothetical protein
MQATFFELLIKAISETRLIPYRQDNDNSNLVCHARYLWNTLLSESLYPPLQGLEVSLRNSIHNAITKTSGSEDWFSKIIAPQEQKVLEEVKDRLRHQKKSLDIGQLVASSSFGFWVSLFDRRYEGTLWPRLLKDIFPHMPNRIRTRKTLLYRLNSIRHLRNRIFHYEPIWYRENLVQDHDYVLEAIGWINPAMLGTIKMLDRFPEVYRQGNQSCEKILSDCMSRLGYI